MALLIFIRVFTPTEGVGYFANTGDWKLCEGCSKYKEDCECSNPVKSNQPIPEIYRRRVQNGLIGYSDLCHKPTIFVSKPYDRKLPTARKIILKRDPSSEHPGLSAFEDQEFQYVDPCESKRTSSPAYPSENEISCFLDQQMSRVLRITGTNNELINTMLHAAQEYCASHAPEGMLKNTLRLLVARFLRRKYWSDGESFLMKDVPARILPTELDPESDQIEQQNQHAIDYCSRLAKPILAEYGIECDSVLGRASVTECYLSTAVIQLILSEGMDQSFKVVVNFNGIDKELTFPWSTFQGKRQKSFEQIEDLFLAAVGPKLSEIHLEVKSIPGLNNIGVKFDEECQNLCKSNNSLLPGTLLFWLRSIYSALGYRGIAED